MPWHCILIWYLWVFFCWIKYGTFVVVSSFKPMTKQNKNHIVYAVRWRGLIIVLCANASVDLGKQTNLVVLCTEDSRLYLILMLLLWNGEVVCPRISPDMRRHRINEYNFRHLQIFTCFEDWSPSDIDSIGLVAVYRFAHFGVVLLVKAWYFHSTVAILNIQNTYNYLLQ
jgi:hypothetical protein